MKKSATILFLLCMMQAVWALDQQQSFINSIKKNKEYLYSEITTNTIEGATSQALDLLQQEIHAWATNRAGKKTAYYPSPVEINKLTDTIMVRRSNMYRVFAFVKKVDLISLFSDWNLVLNDELDGNVSILEENDNEVNDSLPQLIEEPLERQSKETVVNEEVRNLLKSNFLNRKGGVIDQIKKAKNFFELKQIMEPLKAKGYISDYGKYATAKNPEDCYLIVYDPAGNIKAILDKGEKTRRNLKTGQADSIKNYRGCGAIWFTINEE